MEYRTWISLADEQILCSISLASITHRTDTSLGTIIQVGIPVLTDTMA